MCVRIIPLYLTSTYPPPTIDPRPLRIKNNQNREEALAALRLRQRLRDAGAAAAAEYEEGWAAAMGAEKERVR